MATTPNIPGGTINAWIYLDEDDPSGTGYKTPNSSYQSLINNKVYQYTDILNICFYSTIPDGNGYYTIDIGNAAKVHPDGSTTKQYMQYVISDSRALNPSVLIMATLNYNTDNLKRIFSKNPDDWPTDCQQFSQNVLAFLKANKMNGIDIDWEGAFSTAITTAQFNLLFTTMRTTFNADTSGYFYIVLSPADIGSIYTSQSVNAVNTVNTCFDYINNQLYGGFGPQELCSIGVSTAMQAYGAKFESAYQTADQAYAGYSGGFSFNNNTYPYCCSTQWRLNSNNYAYEQSQQILFYMFAKNMGGNAFDDTQVIANAGNPPIVQLSINSGDVLDAIQATNNAGTNADLGFYLLQHGGNGGSNSQVAINAGDSIVQISGYTGNWYGWNVVAQITITTKGGKTYGPFGSMRNVNAPAAFSYSSPGQAIVAFKGNTVHVPEAGGGTSFVVQSLSVSYAPLP